ncbi:DUF2076 domain-containing protein [Shewanella sp. D64]|uniref:DUF2076 domain-containing protein n=1 Tax=unclassified Shewanella TaxID=196818 RepID=UPI0022BA64A7|nr:MULTISPECIES: DUF2076 family protein [unclassified Shewanella]MEC4727706.1 DUF2076 domain-containing protein [Shewanella sp. D64]MEC4739721.1 DUF2076 domain-containing protein [Shewanella sp. E94]WBJ94100.1 DUF2076 domain-containing protein [Shewanella sp. MTB7]
MTPQEKELIQSVADKLKASPNNPKDSEADNLISQEIASQEDIVYKLTQAVLVQEMALKDMKSKNDFLTSQVEHFRKESERGTLSRMIGGTTPAPVQPQPVRQPSAFGGFMQTAASVAAGMVAGHLISNALFGDDEPTAEATPEPDATDTQTAATEPDAGTSADDGADSSFLGDNSGFASEYNDPSSDFGADTLANNGFGEEESFGDDEEF